MENSLAREEVNLFRAPKKTLGDLDAEVAAKLIAAAADIALIIDFKGIIRDVALSSEDFSKEGFESWLGRPWVETVTIESRSKIEALLSDANAEVKPRWRQVNHPSIQGTDVPVRYSAVKIGESGRIVAVGRDLRAIAVLQQRLVDAQQSMEREYARLRHAETRYRLLFQIAAEAVLIVDTVSEKIVEANPVACQILGKAADRIVGRAFFEIFAAESRKRVETHIATVRSLGRADDVRAKLMDATGEFVLSASLFRQEKTSHLLIQFSSIATGGIGAAPPPAKSKISTVIEKLPDGFVVTDLDRRILTANMAFLDLAELASEEQVRGQPLGRWLGRSEVDLNVLLANVREHGSVRHFGTVVRGEYGAIEDIEVSAVSVPHGEQPCFGFTVRNTGRRLTPDPRIRRELPRSVEQLTELVGRVPLKDLVRETTDVIERMCIEAALELTGNNRASAAEMLGLSRQSLYSKLRRFGIGDLEPDPDSEH